MNKKYIALIIILVILAGGNLYWFGKLGYNYIRQRVANNLIEEIIQEVDNKGYIILEKDGVKKILIPYEQDQATERGSN